MGVILFPFVWIEAYITSAVVIFATISHVTQILEIMYRSWTLGANYIQFMTQSTPWLEVVPT